MRRPAALIAALAVLPMSAAAQPTLPAATAAARPAPIVRAQRTTTPMRLEGRLDEEVYTATPAITDFVQQEPFEFQPATERTEAWILFDEDHLYVSARNWESAPEPRRQRDAPRHGAVAAERHLRGAVRHLPRSPQRLHLLRQRDWRHVR